MTTNELKSLLEHHKLWLDSWGHEGRRARLRGRSLRGVDLSGACLRAADLKGADLTGARLRGAELHWALIMSPWVRKMYRQAAERSSIFGSDEPSGVVMGSTAAMYQMQVDRARSNRAKAEVFEKQSTKCADLRRAVFTDADLSDANLTEADLRGADLTGAALSGATLKDARFGRTGIFMSRRTNVSRADLRTAIGLTQAQLDEAVGDSQTRLPPRVSLRV